MSWDLRSNLNAKPGAQGTLFGIDKGQMSPARFHRGYTPGRLNEVRNAIIDNSGTYAETRETITKHLFADQADAAKAPIRLVPPGKRGPSPNRLGNIGEARRNVVDNIARSTVPVEHLSNLQFAVNQERNIHSVEAQRGASLLGHYEGVHDPSFKPYMAPTIHLRSGEEKTDTLIHEIGHHASALQENEHAVHFQRGPETQGREEGFADNYMVEHFRDRRGNGVQRAVAYAGGGDHRGTAFYNGYWGKRGWDALQQFQNRVDEANSAANPIKREAEPDALFHTHSSPRGPYKGMEVNPAALPGNVSRQDVVSDRYRGTFTYDHTRPWLFKKGS